MAARIAERRSDHQLQGLERPCMGWREMCQTQVTQKKDDPKNGFPLLLLRVHSPKFPGEYVNFENSKSSGFAQFEDSACYCHSTILRKNVFVLFSVKPPISRKEISFYVLTHQVRGTREKQNSAILKSGRFYWMGGPIVLKTIVAFSASHMNYPTLIRNKAR